MRDSGKFRSLSAVSQSVLYPVPFPPSGKYIPGRIWAYVAQSYLASQAHVSLAETLYSNAILMCLLSLSSLLVFALSFLTWHAFNFSIRLLAVVSVFSLIYILFRIRLLEKIFNLLFTRLTGIHNTIHCESLYYTNIFIASFLEWSMFTTGLYIIVKSFYPIDMQQGIIIVGTFSISWLVGYYAFLSPGGLGVQEGMQVYLLTFFFPSPISIVIALASRLWMTVGDVLIFCARSQGSNPWQTQVLALGIPLPEYFPLDPVAGTHPAVL